MSPRSLLRDSAKLASSRFSVAVISLAFYSVAAHIVPRADLAPLVAMAVAAELLRVARSLGLTSTMLREVPEHVAREQTARAFAIVRSTLLYTLAVSVVLAGAGWVFRDAISGRLLKHPALSREMAVIIAFALLMGIYDALQIAMLSLQWFGRQSLAYFITLGGQRILALALLPFFGVEGCLFGFLIGAAVGVILCAFWLRACIFARSSEPRLVSFRGLFGYSLPYYAQGFARYVFQEADQLVVGLFLTPELLVTFFIAKRIAHGLRMLIDSVTDVFRPRLGELRAKGEQAVRDGFESFGRFLSLVVLPTCLVVAVFSGPLVVLYAGRQYADAGRILRVLSLAMLVYACFSLYEVGIYMLGKPAHRLWADVVAGAATLLFFLALVSRLGAPGIALGELAGFSVGLIFNVWLMGRICPAVAGGGFFWPVPRPGRGG